MSNAAIDSLAVLIFFKKSRLNVASSNKDSVTSVDAFQNLFLRKLRERIKAEISVRQQVVLSGNIATHADYAVKIEGIRALELVHDKFFEEVGEELLEENRGGPRRRSTA